MGVGHDLKSDWSEELSDREPTRQPCTVMKVEYTDQKEYSIRVIPLILFGAHSET